MFLSSAMYLAFAFSVLFVSSCTGARMNHNGQILSHIESSQEISEVNSRLISQGGLSPATPADFLIGPADLLEIRVFESDKLTTSVRVSSRGQVTLPLLGSVSVDGLTAREAEEKIERLLKEGGYINNPHVSVFVKENRSKLVSVVGYVREPGSYELLGRQTLIDALAAAKGLKEGAGMTVYITRTQQDGRREAFMVDLEELLHSKAGSVNNDINVLLNPGDVIYVPEAGSVFVEGAVRKPGSFPIKEGFTTLSQSIAMAGGVATYADSGDVKLIRYGDNGEREILELDLGKIRSGESPDPLVKDRDAIVVGASTAKRVLYGLRLNFLFGLVGVGYDPPERYRD